MSGAALKKGDVQIGDLLAIHMYPRGGWEFCRVVDFTPSGLPLVVFFQNVEVKPSEGSGVVRWKYDKLEGLEPSARMYAKMLHKGKYNYLLWCRNRVYHYNPQIDYVL